MSIKERLMPKLVKIGKKYHWMKQPILFLMSVLILCNCFLNYLNKNKYKLISILCAVTVFFASNSSISSAYDTPMNASSINAGNVDGEQNVGEKTMEDTLVWGEFPEDYYAETSSEMVESSEWVDSDNVAVYNEKGEQVTASFEDDWKLILVNKQNMVPKDYTFELGTIRGSIQADVRILNELNDMLDAARQDGIYLVVCSGCRDYGRQTNLFDKKIKNYMQNGMSYFEAYSIASQAVTIPGKSEHQIGLALDIVSNTYTSLDTGFADTNAGKWLKEHSAEYGFILRYPLGKENITGIEFEPWHFRYVGKTAAQEITEQQITLEEYVEQIGLK